MRAKVRRERGEGGEHVGEGGGGRWLSNCVQIPPTPIHMHKPSLVLLPVTPATKTALRGRREKQLILRFIQMSLCLRQTSLFIQLNSSTLCI